MKPLASPPLIATPRRAEDIAARLQRLLGEAFGSGPGSDPLRDALVAIGARQGEILTACVNAAPDLHLRAFGEFLAGSARPPAAAHVHLAFKAAPGSTPVVVPMRTRAAAQPLEGDTASVVFETLDDLELVRAEGCGAWQVDAGHRQFGDVGALWTPAGRSAVDAPEGLSPVVQAWHIAHSAAFGLAGLREVRLDVRSAARPGGNMPLPLEWGITTPTGFVPLRVNGDTSDELTRDGTVVLQAPAAWPAASIEGHESRWLTVRPRSVPAPPAGTAPTATQAATPLLREAWLRVSAATVPQPLAAAGHGEAALDLSKDFYPFGERPRFGEVFQLLSPAFSERGAQVELAVELTNPHGSPAPPAGPIEPVSRERRPLLAWEIYAPTGWRPLAVSDHTQALTADGRIAFTVPDDIATLASGGKTGTWVRARLASGDYDADVANVANAGVHIAVPRPPSIRKITVAATLERGPLPAERFVHQGALTSVVREAMPLTPFAIFVAPDVEGPALYLAFDASGAAFASGRVVTLHVRPAPAPPPLSVGGAASEAPGDAAASSVPAAASGPSGAAPRWQLNTASGWQDVAVRDGTQALARSGIVRLQLPSSAVAWPGTALDRRPQIAWLRVVWPLGVAAARRLPLGLALNAVAASHTELLRDELLGSSLGRPGQAVNALRTPVIGAARLQVREHADAAAGWIDWDETDDFSTSPADARHYTLDRRNGEVRFGDGRHGRIPPAGANNIRLHAYTVGGGNQGNRPALSIAQMRSAVPAVAGVLNLEAASGGLDAESDAERHAHASAWLRHRQRAVCADDYADLARKASPEVAVAYCVAGRDLTMPRSDTREPASAPGFVSVIVIGRSTLPRPQPSQELLQLVHDYLDERRAPFGRLVLVGPRYACVSVQLAIDVQRTCSPHAVVTELSARVARFLHPLDGNDDGRGWPVGRRPHRSDLLALAAACEGVARVRSVKLALAAPAGEPWIVAAGVIDVTAAPAPSAGAGTGP